MEGDNSKVIKESLKKKKSSSKITLQNCCDILIVFLAFILAFYVIKHNYTVALFVVILVCVFYLSSDITLIKEFQKCGISIKRFMEKVFLDKSKSQKSKVKGKEINNEMAKIVNKEFIKRKEILMKENDELFRENEELSKQKKEMLEEKERLLKTLDDGRTQNNQMLDVTLKLDELWKLKETMMKELDIERKFSKEMELKYNMLTNDIESERVAYKAWRERESTLRKKLQEEKEKVERDLEEEKMEVASLKNWMGSFSSYVNEEKNRNMKYLNEELSSIIKCEIGKNKEELGTQLGNLLRDMVEKRNEKIKIEKADALKTVAKYKEERDNFTVQQNEELYTRLGNLLRDVVEEKEVKRCDKLEKEKVDMLKTVAMLEEQCDNLMEENRILEMRNDEERETNERRFKKVLENQEDLLKLVKEIKSNIKIDVSSDEEYEVVREI
ncbi:hypothetical protein RND81_14G210500 [Saponaria officinalis]|uniref:Uncharacterized protein n=1 Tax=Saponaria officinalis TaxID=3572 RepID=A0AAW1GV30_SAPOF